MYDPQTPWTDYGWSENNMEKIDPLNEHLEESVDQSMPENDNLHQEPVDHELQDTEINQQEQSHLKPFEQMETTDDDIEKPKVN